MVFPGDALFHHCKSSPSGRVIYLKMTSGRRDFFWIQVCVCAKPPERVVSFSTIK